MHIHPTVRLYQGDIFHSLWYLAHYEARMNKNLCSCANCLSDTNLTTSIAASKTYKTMVDGLITLYTTINLTNKHILTTLA